MIYIFAFFLINIFLVLFFDFFKKRINIIDLPDKKRKLHKIPVPLYGGIFLFINLFLLLIISIFDDQILYNFFQLKEKKDLFIFFFSCLFLFILGLLDDKFKINPYLRFIIFSIIFLVITQQQHLRIEYIQLSFLKDVIDLSYFSQFFTIICFLLFINAFNFFDGINLQSGIYSLILSIIICIINNNLLFFYILQIFLIVFLYLNYKNKTFLGDSGTYLLSFIFAYYFIKFYNDRYIIYADEIAVLMLIPGLDLFRLFFVRIINKKNPFYPDKNHIHHLLLKKFNYIWVNFILFFLIIFSYLFYKIFSIQYLSIFFIIIIYFVLVYYFSKIKFK
jgi:UDP-N-acetylmuramyl pentapeptide phosphotransferase/UDP-N-acetylglucosamine-1-phosphate transferase